jgi:hypothetical protein
MEDDDPFTIFWEGPFLESTALLGALERALVPVEREDAPLPGRARLLVPRSYLGEARAALDGAEGDLVPDTPAELFDDDLDDVRASPRWPLLTRLLIAAVAAFLVIAILLAYRW